MNSTTDTTYPEPRQGVVGTLRIDDDLLSLDEGALTHRVAIVALARHVYDMTLVGNPAPKVRQASRRITQPRLGDLVIENSRTDPVQGFGILLSRRKEWACTDAEWRERGADDPGAYDGERPIDEAWYVQYGPQPDDICRWTNSSFITALVAYPCRDINT